MLPGIIQRNKAKAILIGVAVVAGLLVAYAVRPADTDANLPEMVIQKAELGPLENGYHPLLLETNRGTVDVNLNIAKSVELTLHDGNVRARHPAHVSHFTFYALGLRVGRLRAGHLRSLRQMPPACSYYGESGP